MECPEAPKMLEYVRCGGPAGSEEVGIGGIQGGVSSIISS